MGSGDSKMISDYIRSIMIKIKKENERSLIDIDRVLWKFSSIRDQVNFLTTLSYEIQKLEEFISNIKLEITTRQHSLERLL